MIRSMPIAAAVAMLLAAAPALADDWDFILTNNSGKSIKTIDISPAGADKWQPNKVDPEMKKEGLVKAGGRMTVHFDKDGSQCRFDVKATFEDATSSVWTGINVCDNSYVVVKYDAKGAPTFTAN